MAQVVLVQLQPQQRDKRQRAVCTCTPRHLAVLHGTTLDYCNGPPLSQSTARAWCVDWAGLASSGQTVEAARAEF